MSGAKFILLPTKNCSFCSNLGKYQSNGLYYCSKFPLLMDFEVQTASGIEQKPEGFICDLYEEGRKIET